MLPGAIDAARAEQLGLATRVVEPGQALAAATELATTLAAGATQALAAVKAELAYAAGHPISEALAHEERQQRAAGATEDHAEAVTAFLAKRTPVFHGR
jgi:2-(1,2-epoxy-1,2-dihydrophenyl)acetyl-CoA isomerase